MRLLPLVVAGLLLAVAQTTIVPPLWICTSVGFLGPEVMATLAVFMALRVRNWADAGLAGWVLGLAMDLTLSGEGLGLLSLLYAVGAIGLFSVRELFYRERVLTQVLLSLLFTLFVYQIWTIYQAAMYGSPGGFGARAAQAAGLAVYTGLVAPIMFALYGRAQRLLLVEPAGRGRR